jgi:Tfp pilus assembly protein FimT
MNTKTNLQASEGFSAVELLIVVVLVGITTALAIPQLVSQRRLMRSVGASKQIAAQMRYARQQAMSQRQAITFQYDDTVKQIKIIDSNVTGIGADGIYGTADDAVNLAGYPNSAGSSVATTVPLASAGLASSELNYGIPTSPALPTTALGDGVTKTDISGTGNKLNITFQPDGSVRDSSGNYVNFALYIYNNSMPSATASAISVLGATGRVKIWRYDPSANKYQE